MPKITLNKKETLKLLGKSLSDKKLLETIPLLGTDLDEITPTTIEVEIFPNRPDLLSEEGFARALSSFLGIKTGLKTYKVNSSNYKVKIDPKAKKLIPFTAEAVVKGLNFTNESLTSLMNLQEKLHTTHGRNRKRISTGVYDLSTIKFPIKLTTKPRSFAFHALEDKNKKTIDNILEKHPKGKEYGHLLTKKEVPIWMDANNTVLSMPPVINSETTKVTKNTKELFIEVTGHNKEAVERALYIQLAALSDRGGKIYKIGKSPNLEPHKIKINPNNINKLLGLNLKKQEISRLASKMGLNYNPNNNLVLYPPYRTDILHEVDITEDIAIAYGYDNFSAAIPQMATISEEDSFEKFKNKIADICVGLGLQEVSSYVISNKEDETTKTRTSQSVINLKNAISKEYNILRPWLIPSLLNVLKVNRHNEYPQNIFEIGKVFLKKGSTHKEPTRLAISLCHSKADYTETKRILDTILHNLGLNPTYKTTEHKTFISGRVARVSIKNKDIAFIGEIHPEVINNFELDMPVAMIELNLSELSKLI